MDDTQRKRGRKVSGAAVFHVHGTRDSTEERAGITSFIDNLHSQHRKDL